MAPTLDLVLFDLNNVLCTYDRAACVAYLARVSGNTSEGVYRAIWQSGFEQRGDSGELASADYLRGFGECLSYPLSLDDWLAARRVATTPDRGMLDLVATLRRSVPVAVLTNNADLFADHIDAILPELRPLFGASIYASGQLKAAKPDPVCFQRCLAAIGARPEATLFIDDAAENVAGAEAAGLHGHRFTTVDGLRHTLAAHGLPVA